VRAELLLRLLAATIVLVACSSVPACAARQSPVTPIAPFGPQRFGTSRQVDYGFDFQQSGNYTILNRRGDNSNSEQQCYLPARIGLSSGLLTITAQVSTQTCSDTTNGSASFNYSSGFIQWPTVRSFTSGTLCVRAKVAGGTGPWPAIWLLGSHCQATNSSTADNSSNCDGTVHPSGCGSGCDWPSSPDDSDEIDIAEFLNGTFTTVNQQIHANDGTNNDTGICAAQCLPTITDASLNFHTYCLTRVAGTSLTWYIDGTQTCQKTACISSGPMGLMIDVAMGGTGGGTINNSTLPQTMQVASVTLVQ